MSENLRKDIANLLKTDPKNGVERAFSMLIEKIQTLQIQVARIESGTKEVQSGTSRLQPKVYGNRN